MAGSATVNRAFSAPPATVRQAAFILLARTACPLTDVPLKPLLEVHGLSVAFTQGGQRTQAAIDVSFTLERRPHRSRW